MDNQLDIIVAEVADNLNRGTDFQLKKRIESLAVGYRAMLLRREYEKNGRFAVGSHVTVVADVEKIDKDKELPDPLCFDDELCKARTVSTIPRPVRLRLTSPFSYVGETNGDYALGYSSIANMKLSSGLRFSNKMGRYDYINGHLYFNEYNGKKVLIKYVPADMREIYALHECGELECLDGNFVDVDMKDTIRKMIYEELNQNPVDEEVKINE